ncbi:MAG: hypothetical protein HZA01_13280 [Nitrospinae bacterium]|nr:hypothetical protein [Nitrospinota bacterium]
MRWANIMLRTVHLTGISGTGGGYLYGAPEAHWLPYLWLSLISGGLLAALEVWSNGVWLIQVRGMAVVLKICVLILSAFIGGYGFEAFIVIILISGIVSHAPGSIRYFSIFQ